MLLQMTPSPSGPTGFDPGVALLLGLFFFILVIAAVTFDAWTRNKPPILWALIVAFSGPLGILLYLAIVVYD
jgi:hypothetical protein